MGWAIFDFKRHVTAVNEIVNGSDRVAAIVGGAYLDDTLRRTLETRLREHENIAAKLLNPGRPLGNLEPKIDLLYMLHAFEKPERDSLYGVAKIRNLFAHNLDMSFNSDDKAMLESLKKLTLHEGRTHFPHHIFDGRTGDAIPIVNSNRDQFIVNLQLCLNFLMKDRMRHEPNTNRLFTHEEHQAHVTSFFPDGVP